jgi:DTW domain-containing protein
VHRGLCVCALAPRLETRTRLVVVLHRSEDRKSSNTGRLAAECIAGSVVHVRGHRETQDARLTWDPSTQPLLLFPHEDALPLARFAGGAPVTLIVPDGTWRQASKVRARVPGLRDVRCVTLPPGPPSSYRLRAESHAPRLATIEAIARAMGVLEGPAVEAALSRVFHALVERTLWARGDLAADDVRDGIPAGAMRHDPESGVRGVAASAVTRARKGT